MRLRSLREAGHITLFPLLLASLHPPSRPPISPPLRLHPSTTLPLHPSRSDPLPRRPLLPLFPLPSSLAHPSRPTKPSRPPLLRSACLPLLPSSPGRHTWERLDDRRSQLQPVKTQGAERRRPPLRRRVQPPRMPHHVTVPRVGRRAIRQWRQWPIVPAAWMDGSAPAQVGV